MTLYYLKLAMIGIRGNPAQAALMVIAIALGVGVCMSIGAVNYLMGKNPIPHKSDQLFYVQLDNWDPNHPFNTNEPPDQVTWRDADALMSAKRGYRQTKNTRYSMVVRPDDPEIRPFQVNACGNTTDFFDMFETPFLYGSGWPSESERGRFDADLVVVLSRETNERIFGGVNSLGRDIRLGEHLFRVVGVLDEWNPVPKFYDLTNNPFGDAEDLYFPVDLPYQISSSLQRTGNTNCWKGAPGGFRGFLGSECIWLQYWVELRNDQERDEYMQFLNDYVAEQRENGRFQRPTDNRLSNVGEWLDKQRVVEPGAQMMLAVALMFLAVCLLNTVGLLLSKFLGKAPEVGVRRALGASRRTLLYQYLIETSLVGVTGGILGLLMTWLGLEAMMAIFGSEAANLMKLDSTMVVATVVLALISSISAGLYPTWRACNISPASQLRSQ